MIFYRPPGGLLVGTQAAAGKDFETVDVPTDKYGLMEYLNQNCRCEPQHNLPLTDEPQRDRDLESKVAIAAIPYADKVRILREIKELTERVRA